MVNPPYKVTRILHMVNTLMAGLFIFLLLLCVYNSIVGIQWTLNNIDQPYLAIRGAHEPDGFGTYTFPNTPLGFGIEAFLTYCVTFSHMIPMSLYIACEILKIALAQKINFDKAMVHYLGNGPQYALARTSDLIEEL